MVDYRRYYDLESYLFDDVRYRFHEQGRLAALDFFCIVIWKANRAKSKIARRLLSQGHPDLDTAVEALTAGLSQQADAKERLCYLRVNWKIGLPMCSAILTVLYPEEFTVYDVRVCDTLGAFHNLGSLTNFEHLWRGYQEFKRRVLAYECDGIMSGTLSLRDKDRYMWGQSFHKQLVNDITEGFPSR